MKLFFKQRFFSWFDSYDIYDENGNTLYTVEGKLSWGHCLHILDKESRHIGTVKERVLTFLPKFEIYQHDEYKGCIRKEFTLFAPKFTLDCNDWTVEGDIFGWDYEILSPKGRTVAEISKKLWNLTDTYFIDVLEERDALMVLMVVLAIDAEKCSGN